MNWLLISLIPPVCWSISCVIDEYLTQKNPHLNGFNFIILQSLVSIIPALFLLIYRPETLQIAFDIKILFGLLGIYFSLCFIPYIIAIKKDGSGIVVPFYQTLPLFIFLLAWLTLGETINFEQIIISIFIVIFACLSMIDETKGFKWASIGFMTVSCVLLSIYVVFTRNLTVSYHWLDIAIWNYIGAGIGAFLYLCFSKNSRMHAATSLRNLKSIVPLFTFQTLLDVKANIFWILALSIAPSAGLVQTINAVQPFFVLVFATIAFKFAPHIYTTPSNGKVLIWRLFCFAVIFLGIYLLSTI
jgi:drug/metabolite transporter (DMT)-like permease